MRNIIRDISHLLLWDFNGAHPSVIFSQVAHFREIYRDASLLQNYSKSKRERIWRLGNSQMMVRNSDDNDDDVYVLAVSTTVLSRKTQDSEFQMALEDYTNIQQPSIFNLEFVCTWTYPHSTVILKDYFKNIPLKSCNIAKILIKLWERFLKYWRNLAMSVQNIINGILLQY